MIARAPAPEGETRCSCPHPQWAQCKRSGEDNIVQRAWPGKDKHIERLGCTVCGRAFAARAGTLRARSKLSEATVEQLLPCQRWGVCDAGTAAIGAVDLKTVPRLQGVAAQRAMQPHQQSVPDVEGLGVPLDEAQSTLRPTQVAWGHTAVAMGSGCRLWVDCGRRTQETAATLIAPVSVRTRQLPLFLTDGWKADTAALLQVVGRVYRPRRRGQGGRQPHPRLAAPKELDYAPVVKVRNKAGQVVEGSRRVVFGGPRRCLKQWRLRQCGETIQTACMERWYGPLRGLVAPRRRRTRGFSWSHARPWGTVWLRVSLSNFVRPPKSLRQGHTPRTPAMAIGLTDHIWSYREYIWVPVHPDPVLTKQMDERMSRLLIPALQDQPAGGTQAPPAGKTNKKEATPRPKAA